MRAWPPYTVNKAVMRDMQRRAIINQHVKICERFEQLDAALSPQYKRMKLMMDLESVPDWDFENLLTSPVGDFGHDVAGLMNHIDRSTYPGKLPGWFAPRCGYKKAATT